MYSPPLLRTIAAILAKLSEPKNRLGLMITYSGVSVKLSMSSNSVGNIVRTSLVERIGPLGTVDTGAGAGAGVGVVEV